jgi:hypothetical protein
MFAIEHRKGDKALGQQLIYSRVFTDALASACRMAARLGADHMTISDPRGNLIGVFQASGRSHA